MPYTWTPADLDVLVAQSAATKPAPIDPVQVALLLWIESAGFNPGNPGPAAANPQVGGLNQMSTPNLVQLGQTRAAWLAMTAGQQLPIIFRFWVALAKTFNGGRFPKDGAHLLGLNFLPGSYKTSGADANENAPICGKAGPYSQYYAGNAYYDPGQLGAITVATIRVRQVMEAQSGGARWQQLVAGIRAAQQRAGGSTPPAGPPIGSAPPSGSPPSSPAPSSGARSGGGLIALLALGIAGVIAKVRV
jgi:hypothetical protein